MVAVTALLAAPAAARAEVGVIAGNPLIVYADGLGTLQFRFDGQPQGVFYGADDNVASAGLELREGDQAYGIGERRTPLAGPTVVITGAGARALHSVYRVGDHFEVTEDVTYVDRTRDVGLRYVIRNVSDSAVSFAAGELADLYAAGSDTGTGAFEPGPPRFVGGASADGSRTGLVESTPWTHYQSGYYAQVFYRFRDSGLNDSVDPNEEDNGAGAEWVINDLAPGASTTIDVTWRLGEPTRSTRVTTTDDHFDDSSTPCTADDCTLREAIYAAAPGSIIDVPAGEYVLDEGELLTGGVVLRGAGAAQTVIRAPNSRVFSIDNGIASISGMHIADGDGVGESGSGTGGGVRIGPEASLVLSDVVLSGNRAKDGGGAIYNAGSLTLSRSLLVSNTAIDPDAIGGAIATVNYGTTEISSSTISTNASRNGGALGTDGSGTLTLRNVTVADNAGEGLYIAPPTDKGKAAAPNSSVTVRNTIFEDNDGGACGGDTPGVSGHNLSDDSTCAFAAGGDRQGVRANLQPLTSTGVHPLVAGSPALDAADDAVCPGSDQLGTARPQGEHCDLGAYELPFAAPVTPTPTPVVQQGTPTPAPTPVVTATPTPTQPLPAPVAGKNVNAVTKSGTVTFKLPGSKKFTDLGPGRQIPLGTVVDAKKGKITLTSAADRKGKTQSADFYDGIFKIGQTKGAKPVTELTLVEALACKKQAKAAGAAAKKPKSRKLWGDGKGSFRTRGNYSSATVRGTNWLTEDRCDSTLTRVKRGLIQVRDLVKKRTVLVKAGKRYVARAKRR